MNKKDFFHSEKPIKDQVISGLKLLYQIPRVVLLKILKFTWRVIYLSRRVLILFGSLFLIVIVIIPLFLSVFFGRDVELNDNDMQLEKSLVPIEQDAYYVFTEGLDSTFISDLEADLDLDKFDKVVEMDYIVDPFMRDLDFKAYYSSPRFFPIRFSEDLAEAAQLRALEYENSGEIELAVNEAMKIIKFGQMISRDTSLVSYLAGIRIKRIGMDLYSKLLTDNKIPYSALRNDLEILKDYNASKADTSVKLNYLSAKYHIKALRGELTWTNARVFGNALWERLITFYLNTSRFYYKPNMLLNGIANKNREAIEYFNLPCTELNIYADRDVAFKSVPEIFKMYFTENSLGDDVFKFVGLDILSDRVKPKKCLSQSILNALKIKMASKLYLIDNDRLPQTLDELSPKYLDVVPVDVYTGEIPEYDYDDKILKVNIPQGNVVHPSNISVYDLNFK